MRLPALALALLGGCGFYAYDYDVRAVIGVAPQHVPAAALPRTAIALAIHADTDITYPLHRDGTDLVLDSAYTDDVPAMYEAWDAHLGADSVPLALPVPRPPPPRDMPGVLALTGKLELSVIGVDTVVPVVIAPIVDPCGDGAGPIAPAAFAGSAACLDGTTCAATGAPFEVVSDGVVVPPFTIQIVIQVSCTVDAS